jgi:hypothetical protein
LSKESAKANPDQIKDSYARILPVPSSVLSIGSAKFFQLRGNKTGFLNRLAGI